MCFKNKIEIKIICGVIGVYCDYLNLITTGKFGYMKMFWREQKKALNLFLFLIMHLLNYSVIL